MRDSLERTMLIRHNFNSRRRVLLYGFLGILCFVRTIESAPLTESKESSRLESTGTLASGLLSKKSQEEEVGNPSEIAFKAWLMINQNPDSQQSGGLDSASLLRRIKPKSVFVAPNLTPCAEGYEDDTLNRCIQNVNINTEDHQAFLVHRLQTLFGAGGSFSSRPSSSSDPSGPFQLNIPLTMSDSDQPPPENVNLHSQNLKEATSTTDSSKIISEVTSMKDKIDDSHEDAIVTVYELDDEESTFFLGNKSSGIAQENNKSHSTSPDLMVPVAEFVDDVNTNLSGIIDYKVPVAVMKMHNFTVVVDGSDHKEIHEEKPTGVQDNVKETNISPTVILVLSSTKVPSIPVPRSDLTVSHNSSLEEIIVKMENITGNASKEIIKASVSDPIATSSPINEDNSDFEEDSTAESKIVTDFASGEDNTTESTESYYEETYEESTENEDEILKHSEAGMTVTLPTPGERVTVKSAMVYSDKEATGSSEISSEVSINGDFVRETTLVNLKMNEASNFTSSSHIDDSEELEDDSKDIPKGEDTRVDVSNVKKLMSIDISNRNEAPHRKMPIVVVPARPKDEELEETIRNGAISTEKADSAETMIASSTNDAGTFVSREEPKFHVPFFPSSKKRTGRPFRFETTTKIPHKSFSTASNFKGVYDYDSRDHPRRNSYGVHEDDGLQNFIGAQQQDYMKFSSFDRHGWPNYMRSPSEEANSINRNDYKEHRPYRRYQQQQNYDRRSPTTKNSSGLNIHQQRNRSGTDRSRQPMLWQFWTRMPLVRDQSGNYHQHPTYPTVGARIPDSARRVNYHKEMSTQRTNRAFVRKSLTSAIGG